MENQTNLPRHLGIIMDGNRRWAKANNLPTLEGHRYGGETLKKIALAAKKRGIKILTFFCFSTENWNRTEKEVNYFLNLLHEFFLSGFEKINEENIKIKVIGQRDRLPEKIIDDIEKTESKTKNNDAMTVYFALSYGGRDEIVQAVKKIAKSGINPENITEETISKNVWAPDVDLIIRTSGEQRISGFLLWQAAYSEFLFVKKHWPDFSEADLDAALAEYASRQRRFGK
jgi:undecaprenyl diphosphate synthase